MLREYNPEHEIVHLDDDPRFNKRTPDVELIRALSNDRPRWVLLTADLNMKRKYPQERKALADSGLSVIFLKKGFTKNLNFHTRAVKLLERWPDIVKQTSEVREPTAFEVSPKAQSLKAIGPTRLL